MPDVERALRDLLTDDRLDVPVRADAARVVEDGVRHRRAVTRGALGATAVVVILAGATAVANGSWLAHKEQVTLGTDDRPSATTAPSTPDSSSPAPTERVRPEHIAWAARPYDDQRLAALRAAQGDPTVPPCTPEQLEMTATQGASGGVLLTAENTGSVCGLQGPARVEGYDDAGRLIATEVDPEDFLVPHWLRLNRGDRATSGLTVNSHGPSCTVGVTRLRVWPNGDGIFRDVDADITAEWFEPYKECGAAPVSPDDPYVLRVEPRWQPVGHAGDDYSGGLDASIRLTTSPVLPGTLLHYQVRVNRTAASEAPCVPFRERLVADYGEVVATETYLLPCPEIRAAQTDDVMLEMQLALPPAAATGDLFLEWTTATTTGTSTSVHVSAAPAPCRQDQLSLRPGQAGPGLGNYRQDVVLDNVSKAACSLRGFPGVEFVDDSGAPLPTDPSHGSSYFWGVDAMSTISLAPGGSASFGMAGATSDRAHPHGCPTADVKVIPPGLTTQTLVHVSWPYCNDGAVDVSPVVEGDRGPT